MRLHRGARAARGVSVALFATFVALMSHVAGGGQPPGWLGVLAPFVLATTVSTVLAGHRLSLWRLGSSVAASQLLFHALFSLGAPDGSRFFHGNGHHQAASIATAAFAGTPTHVHGASGMWIAHAIAAFITVAGIYVGERSVILAAAAVTQMQTWLQRAVAFVTASSVTTSDAPVQVGTRTVRALRSLCVLTGDRRRGPPLAFGI